MARKTLVLIVVLQIAASCKVMHVPGMQNVPMFSKKGELRATLSANDLQFSYSVSDKVGFALNGFYRPGWRPYLSDGKTANYKGANHGWDAAVGFYGAMPKSSFEFLMGYGQGYSSLSYDYSINRSLTSLGGSSHFRRYFIQPGLILSGTGKMKVGLTTKFDIVSFYDFLDRGGQRLKSNSLVFFSPALTLRREFGSAALTGQIQYSSPQADINDSFGAYAPFKSMLMLHLGLVIAIDKLVKKGRSDQSFSSKALQ